MVPLQTPFEKSLPDYGGDAGFGRLPHVDAYSLGNHRPEQVAVPAPADEVLPGYVRVEWKWSIHAAGNRFVNKFNKIFSKLPFSRKLSYLCTRK